MRRRTLRSRSTDRGAPVLEKLLVQAGRGDRQAVAELYDRIAPLLFTLCIGSADDWEAAQRRLMHAFVRVWQNAPRYEGTGALDWMCQQARC